MASSRYFRVKLLFCRSAVAAVLLVLVSDPVFAKMPELSAIEVYPTAGGQGYVQITGFVLTPKNEVHLCTSGQTINKNSYGKLPKIELSAGWSLERAKNGELLLNRGGAPECVVPVGVKLEKDEGETPAQLAEKTELQGQIVAKSIPSTASIPPLAPGVKIVLVNAPDTELAEFLLAQRSDTIAGWKAYLGKYPSGPHIGNAKAALSTFLIRDGQTALAGYEASLKGTQPDYSKLQAAKIALDSALVTTPDNPETASLAAGIHQESRELNSKGLAEISQYRDALTKQGRGYAYLVSAEAISQVTLGLEPKSAETASLSQACIQERTMLDHRLVDFANKLSAKRPDEAYEAIKPIRSFAGEYPKIQDDLNALYAYYVELGKQDAAKFDPDGAVAAFQKAQKVEATPEIAQMLLAAQQQAQESTDKAAVQNAMTRSTAAEEDKNIVLAYEVLDDLTPSQKKQAAVEERLDSLKDRFVPAASNMAKELQRAHNPIKGPEDEAGIQLAYSLMARCYAITKDSSYDDRTTALGQYLGDYYLERAKHYLERPEGAGANVGWAFLNEALQYNRENANAVQDEKMRANAVHQLRSRLSFRIVFHDRTPGRDAADFPGQLADSVAAGLDSSGLNIKVARSGEETKVPPNFLLTLDVLQYANSNTPEELTKTSKYRSGEGQINEAWAAAEREYESANLTLGTDRAALEGAEAGGKKNKIADARRQTDEAQKRVMEASAKRDALPKFRDVGTERPYTYTEQINQLKGTVELGFTIQDSAESVLVPTVKIVKTQEQAFTVLKNVKPDDTMGIRNGGEVPNETAFLKKVANSAQDELLTQAKENISKLPALILQTADHKAAAMDNDGAAELYMLYLDSTESHETPERRRAQKFLLDNYNLRAYGDPPKT